jgi:hypothetical protein
MEVAEENARKKRRRPVAERKNSPVEIRELALIAQISECINLGLSRGDAENQVLGWNDSQAAPLAVGKVKKQVYLSYAAVGR